MVSTLRSATDWGTGHRVPVLWAAAVIALLAFTIYRLGAGAVPNFSRYEDTERLKSAFFDWLGPIAHAENDEIRMKRERLLAIARAQAEGQAPGFFDRRWLKHLADDYGVDWDADDLGAVSAALQRRVDVVPLPLVLVQAAAESGWGRSRFAVKGNNLFGVWCYEKGCGIVPDDRPAGAAHEVTRYRSVRQAVAAYLKNMNTHPGHRELRRLRQSQRAAGVEPDAQTLVAGLGNYSERGADYVEEIRSMLAQNRSVIREATAQL